LLSFGWTRSGLGRFRASRFLLAGQGSRRLSPGRRHSEPSFVRLGRPLRLRSGQASEAVPRWDLLLRAFPMRSFSGRGGGLRREIRRNGGLLWLRVGGWRLSLCGRSSGVVDRCTSICFAVGVRRGRRGPETQIPRFARNDRTYRDHRARLGRVLAARLCGWCPT